MLDQHDAFMLSALIRLIRTYCALTAFSLIKLCGWLFRSERNAGIRTPETDITHVKTQPDDAARISSPGVDQPEAETLPPDAQEFPVTSYQAKKAFIESLDSDAVCALASRFNNGTPCRVVKKRNGSFNVCFFIEFNQDGPRWVVRVPIEPALENPWDKLVSEVTTMRYLECNTQIPVTHVHAYGRDAQITKTSTGTQMFLIEDLIPGEPLDEESLIEAAEEHRRNFYSQLIGILAELRKLEFSSIGSLMPNPDGSLSPILGPVFSMSAAILRRSPQYTFSSAKDFMTYQFGLVSDCFLSPVRDHGVEEIKEEIFALHGMERIFKEVIDTQLDAGPFVLNHLDLRGPNIIVNKNLQIQAIIDWEFAGVVPRQVFTPPSWITGHDSIEAEKHMHAEFRDVLEKKSKTDSLCEQLRTEWYGRSDAGKPDEGQIDRAFCVAYVLRCPTDVRDIFCDFFAPKLSGQPLDDMVSVFFKEHQELELEVQRRAKQCERYDQYLKKNGLYESDLDRLLAKLEAIKKEKGLE